MNARATAATGPSYPLGAVVRLTGLGEHTIRAWERRYGAVRPGRTPGGTRRYSAADVARLRLLRAGVEAGHRISDLASHSDVALERLLSPPAEAAPPEGSPLNAIRSAVERLDLQALDRLLSLQFVTLGPEAFARRVAAPLLYEIGERWEHGEGSVASEHLLSSVTRGILGVALRSASADRSGPRVLFTTPQGELHEFGALIAAIVALGAGAAITYLGPNLPVDEVVGAARQLDVQAVALGVVQLAPSATRKYLKALRKELPEPVALWLGGPVRGGPFPGVELLDLDEMERRIGRLARTPG
jgi:DNA-binding transcriptional MerR regulator/methylmalonyl-CoA mutase cobalamin-binding subunit